MTKLKKIARLFQPEKKWYEYHLFKIAKFLNISETFF